MSEFVFDDIYGNEGARDRYEHHRQFSYFNTILKLHNKYYEDNKMHEFIFSPRKTTPKLAPLPPKKQHNFLYYSVEKVNNLTFRINRKNLAREKNEKSITISQLGHHPRPDHPQVNRYAPPSREQSKELNRDIIKDAQFLKTTLQISKKDRTVQKHPREPATGRSNRPNIQSVSKQLYNFVELAQTHLS